MLKEKCMKTSKHSIDIVKRQKLHKAIMTSWCDDLYYVCTEY